MRFLHVQILALLLVSPVIADPPKFDPPEQIPIIAGQVAIYQPPADCVSVKYIGLDGEEEFPLDLIGGSKTGFAFLTRGLPTGSIYRFIGVASSATGEQVEKAFSVTIPGDTAPPPKKPPVEPPVVSGKYYFLIVRPNGNADPAFTTAMGLGGWSLLKSQGHTYKPKTLEEATALGLTLPPGTQLPCVVTLQEVGDTSKIVRGPIPFPTTDDAILELPKGIK